MALCAPEPPTRPGPTFASRSKWDVALVTENGVSSASTSWALHLLCFRLGIWFDVVVESTQSKCLKVMHVWMDDDVNGEVKHLHDVVSPAVNGLPGTSF